MDTSTLVLILLFVMGGIILLFVVWRVLSSMDNQTIREALIELQAISGFIDWLERLIAILARPIFMACIAYAAAKSILHFKDETWDTVYIISQVLAFECSAPGLKSMAEKYEMEGNHQKAEMLKNTATAGMVLGIVTLMEIAYLNLNIWPDSHAAISQLMLVARGGMSVFFLGATGHLKKSKPTISMRATERADIIQPDMEPIEERTTRTPQADISQN